MRSELIQSIGNRLADARAAARREGFRKLLGQSISLTHLQVLLILRSEGPRPVGELARHLGTSVPSTTGIVSRMEERGLVERARGEDDRRIVVVHILPGGEEALDQMEGRGRDHLMLLLECLSTEELEMLDGGLTALQRAREQILDASQGASP